MCVMWCVTTNTHTPVIIPLAPLPYLLPPFLPHRSLSLPLLLLFFFLLPNLQRRSIDPFLSTRPSQADVSVNPEQLTHMAFIAFVI